MTKLFTLAAPVLAAALALTAGAASAENAFQLDRARSTAAGLEADRSTRGTDAP